jgi:hypothetical protein
MNTINAGMARMIAGLYFELSTPAAAKTSHEANAIIDALRLFLFRDSRMVIIPLNVRGLLLVIETNIPYAEEKGYRKDISRNIFRAKVELFML